MEEEDWDSEPPTTLGVEDVVQQKVEEKKYDDWDDVFDPTSWVGPAEVVVEYYRLSLPRDSIKFIDSKDGFFDFLEEIQHEARISKVALSWCL